MTTLEQIQKEIHIIIESHEPMPPNDYSAGKMAGLIWCLVMMDRVFEKYKEE